MSFTGWRLRLGLPPASFTLLVIVILTYVLQFLNDATFHLPLVEVFGVSSSGAIRWRVWQFLTYQFLHGGFFHVLINMLMFYFLGPEVERAVGRSHFLRLYFLSGVLGGLGWLLMTYPYEGVCVGASAGIFGLLSAFAVLYPQRDVTLLLFLVFPITMKAWVLAVALGFVQLLFTISPGGGGIAYSAHLAGALAGLIYALMVFRPDLLRLAGERARAGHHARRVRQRQVQSESDRAELDRLLDKISREGIHSLTPAERNRLETASRRFGVSR